MLLNAASTISTPEFAAIISVAGSTVGLMAAYATNIPASATIVLTLIVIYAAARLWKQAKRSIHT